LFIPVCVFCFLFCLLSPLVWFFLWLPEQVLALLFLHREYGDFSIVMKDISFMGQPMPQLQMFISYSYGLQKV
jgi:hypothetical protein